MYLLRGDTHDVHGKCLIFRTPPPTLLSIYLQNISTPLTLDVHFLKTHSEHSLSIPHPLHPITSHFCLNTLPPRSERHMYHPLYITCIWLTCHLLNIVDHSHIY